MIIRYSLCWVLEVLGLRYGLYGFRNCFFGFRGLGLHLYDMFFSAAVEFGVSHNQFKKSETAQT